jgi:hypothetical protein
MNNTITDVIIHTNKKLSDLQFTELSERVHDEYGVVSLGRNSHTPKFLMVVYNAAKTQSRSILKTVTDQGYDATLVGI